MQRAAKLAKVSEYTIEFTISARRLPKKLYEFNGYFDGECTILMCAQDATLRGRKFKFTAKNIISYSGCFVYRTDGASISNGKVSVDKHHFIKAMYLKDLMTREDMADCFAEMSMPEEVQAEVYLGIKNKGVIAKDTLMPHLSNQCEALKVPRIQNLSYYMRKDDGFLISDQRERIRKLLLHKLEDVVQCLKTTPWLLVFKSCVKRWNLKTMTDKRSAEACNEFGIEMPQYVRLSIEIYAQTMQMRAKSNNTLFDWEETRVKGVKEFLKEHAIVFVDSCRFALREDFTFAKYACQDIMRIIESAKSASPVMRESSMLPIVPPTLTEDQTKIANLIMKQAVTIVEGLPGTGKTAIITWALCQFSNILIVSFTGMTVKMLQKRNGGHVESAHTLHSIIYTTLFSLGGRQWVRQFDVVVIDEFSNTGMKLFSQFLECLSSNVVKLILVGDYQQIHSITPGDPMGDLRLAFGYNRLGKILRVDQQLKDLYTAPKLVVELKSRAIVFNPRGPISMVMWDENYERVLKPILSEIVRKNKCLMDFHIVVLQNSVRHKINTIVQSLLIELGILKKPKVVHRINLNEIFVGCKITFTRNYNKEVKLGEAYRSDPVANGELAIVRKIKAIKNGYVMKIDDASSSFKTIILGPVISFSHFELGYATTANKVQGKEFAQVIFWNNWRPAQHWTRAHAYVAISRGKERVWVVSDPNDFHIMCQRNDATRRTVFDTLMRRCIKFINQSGTIASKEREHGDVEIMDVDEMCVPVRIEQ